LLVIPVSASFFRLVQVGWRAGRSGPGLWHRGQPPGERRSRTEPVGDRIEQRNVAAGQAAQVDVFAARWPRVAGLDGRFVGERQQLVRLLGRQAQRVGDQYEGGA
jgi:hypothetical protein